MVMFAARRVSLAALMALGFPVAAQQTIQFSKPANQDPAATANANAIMPSASHKAPSAFNAPTSLFGNSGATASFDILPGSPPPAMPNPNAAQWQKVLENRKNWSLMTPEQILGIPTPESILGVTDPQEDPKLSPEERFLRRQERQEQAGITNASLRSDAFLWHNDDENRGLFQSPDANNPLANAPGGSSQSQGIAGLIRNSSPFFNQTTKSLADMNQRMDSTWEHPFGSPEPMPKATPEQLSGMERFRALMEPTPPQTPSAAPGFSSQPSHTPDPFLQPVPASFNPAGRSFTGLGNDIAKPTGLAPLPGVTGPRPPPSKPAPLVQTPPWLSQSPQSANLPQRQF